MDQNLLPHHEVIFRSWKKMSKNSVENYDLQNTSTGQKKESTKVYSNYPENLIQAEIETSS